MNATLPHAPVDFREQLSAWHDGALSDEAARFVVKRLLGDEGLRAEVGRWQLLGDALRREAQHAAPRGLAAAVQARIAADGRVDAAQPALPVARRRGPVGGVAVAAAVGLAAVLFWPNTASDSVDAPALAGAANPAAAPAAVPAIDVPIAPVAPIERSIPRVLVARAGGADADPGRAFDVPPLMRAPQPTAEQLAPLPAIDAPSRPWPRSDAQSEAFVVDYAAPGGAPPRR